MNKLFLTPSIVSFAFDAGQIWSNSSSDIKNLVNQIFFPVIAVVLAILLIMVIVKSVIDYNRGNDVSYIKIIILFIAFGILLALRINSLWYTIFVQPFVG